VLLVTQSADATVSAAPLGARSPEVTGRAGVALIGLASAALLTVAAAGPSAVASPVPAAPGWPPLRLPDAVVMGMTWAAVALGGAGVLVGLAAVRRGWRPRASWLLAAGAAAVAAFVVTLPLGSNDLLYYAVYGRISALGHNPYLLTPAWLQAAGDPVARSLPAGWLHVPSVYGPLATLTEKAAALLAGPSMARTVFWLKVWDGLAFIAIAVALDRALRHDGAARVRAHLLWTVNPLMLLAAVAGGHVDVLAAAAGLAGLLAYRRTDRPHRNVAAGLAAGAAVGAAATVKAPFLLYGVALAAVAYRGAGARPMSQRLLAVAALAAGVAIVLVPCYVMAGSAAIADLAHKAAWPVAVAGPWAHLAGTLQLLALAASALLAVALLRGLPRGAGAVPLAKVALALSLGWLVASPQQRPWFDAMIFPLLALMPASRLDLLVMLRAGIAALGELPGAVAVARLTPAWLGTVSRVASDDGRPACLAAVALILAWLAVTNGLHAQFLPVTAHPRSRPDYSQPKRPARRPWHTARIRSCADIPPSQRATHGPAKAIRRNCRVLERQTPQGCRAWLAGSGGCRLHRRPVRELVGRPAVRSRPGGPRRADPDQPWRSEPQVRERPDRGPQG
jgi:hypothetical protein